MSPRPPRCSTACPSPSAHPPPRRRACAFYERLVGWRPERIDVEPRSYLAERTQKTATQRKSARRENLNQADSIARRLWFPSAVRILFAGASGVLGRATLPHLDRHDVVALTRSPEKLQFLRELGAEAALCDVYDSGARFSTSRSVRGHKRSSTSSPIWPRRRQLRIAARAAKAERTYSAPPPHAAHRASSSKPSPSHSKETPGRQ